MVKDMYKFETIDVTHGEYASILVCLEHSIEECKFSIAHNDNKSSIDELVKLYTLHNRTVNNKSKTSFTIHPLEVECFTNYADQFVITSDKEKDRDEIVSILGHLAQIYSSMEKIYTNLDKEADDFTELQVFLTHIAK